MNGCKKCPAYAKCTETYRGSGCAALRWTYGLESDPKQDCTDREKLIELIFDSGCVSGFAGSLADYLINHGVTLPPEPRPLDDWGEDYGDALWWKFPIEEPPYVGSPLDLSWPGYHTHWTPIPLPQPPKED